MLIVSFSDIFCRLIFVGNLLRKINLVWHVNCVKGRIKEQIPGIKIAHQLPCQYCSPLRDQNLSKENERSTAYIIIRKKYRYPEGLR